MSNVKPKGKIHCEKMNRAFVSYMTIPSGSTHVFGVLKSEDTGGHTKIYLKE